MRGYILGFLAVLAATPLFAMGTASTQALPVAQDYGNSLTFFSVTCSSNAWTSLAAASQTRRVLFIQREPTATTAQAVCVSTISAGGTTCASATSSLVISTVTPQVMIYSGAALNCRSIASDTLPLAVIKGFSGSDAEDSGGFPGSGY